MTAPQRKPTLVAYENEAANRDVIDLAYLGKDDFYYARALGVELRDWNYYEDFRDERDSQLIGYCAAGVYAYQTPICVSCFVDWTSHARPHLSVQSLDDFAGIIRTFRLYPKAPLETVSAQEWNEGKPKGGLIAGRLLVPISTHRYERWLEGLTSIGAVRSNATIRQYARLLMQHWADNSTLRSDVGE